MFFSITSHIDRLVVYVVLPHMTAFPELGEPRVHATVTHDARAQMPTCGRLQKGVGVGIRLAEVVSP
jgi:hypothetical protein